MRRDLIVDLPQSDKPLWVSLCFCEQPVDPARPVLPDACGASPDCVFGKLRDAVRVRVSQEQPPEETSCDSCCSPCADPCVVLARIDKVVLGQPLTIQNEVRRPITPYLATRIKEVSWVHGATYTMEKACEILESLTIRFTRPVLTSTLRRGVVDVWVIEGGTGRHADIYNRDGTIAVPEYLPDPRETDTLIFKADTDETLQHGDRVLITIRTAFLLDHCCRPVDGENIGGRVPAISGSPHGELNGSPSHDCPRSPLSFGPWTSGNGSPAGTFESWFFVKDSQRKQNQQGGKYQ